MGHTSRQIEYETIANFLLKRTAYRPRIGIICGSGLSGLSNELQNAEVINYADIPGFPQTTVQGHSGELVFGELGGIPTVCMKGRFHYYEGHPMHTVTMPVRVMRLLGVQILIVTNAAGGLNSSFNVGDFMVINDHFGMPTMAGNNALIGPNEALFGDRFPPMSDVHDAELREVLLSCASAQKLDDKMRTGTYTFVSGPGYESPHEAQFLRSVGGDAVGMSTVPEMMVARHCGMKVIGLSLVTNKVLMPGDMTGHASHEEVLEATVKAARDLQQLIASFAKHPGLRAVLDKAPRFTYTPTELYLTHRRTEFLRKAALVVVGLGYLGFGFKLFFNWPARK